MADSAPKEFVDLVAISRGYQRSQALRVAAELGIADILSGGPLSVGELAATTRSHQAALYRLLRALSAIGVFHEDSEHRFALTAMGEYLRTDHARSVDPVIRMFCADYEWRAWGDLLHSVQTGENAAVHVLGMDIWEYRREHPDHGQIFDAAMRTLSGITTPDVLSAYDFGRHRVVADIGGGTGTMLASILASNPGVRGILFDQAHVVAHAGPVLEAAGVANRVEVVPGDFFEAVPRGADLYLLRRILHDWPDDRSTQILRRVHQAMTPEARLVIVDAVIGPPNHDPLAKFLDLMMLVSAGGHERTEPEWITLLATADFRFERATPATSNSHVIEATPAAQR